VASGPELLDGRGAIVDIGYGETPVTTLEWARTVRALNPALRVVGVEKAARKDEELELVAGDFRTCATLGPTAVVRAMNVLRGYREDEVPAIHQALGAGLVDGGLLIEGSTDTEGHVMVAHLLRRRGAQLVREALLFHTDFSRGFSPWLFRDWLPRDLRRNAKPGTAIHALLTQWDEQAKGGNVDPRARFGASVRGVVEATDWELEHGFARAPLPPPHGGEGES
jgi:hypothetical protein